METMDNTPTGKVATETASILSPPVPSRPARVALAFPGCHRRGGVERIMLECARYLGARHDVTVFANQWDEPPPVREGWSTFQYQFVPAQKQPGFLYGRSFFHNATQQLNFSDFDAVGTFGCVAPLGGVTWVQSVHAAWLERSRQIRAPRSWARLRQKINPLHPVLLDLERKHFAERGYRKVIALTPEVQSDLQRIYGVPTEDIVVIPNGFAPDEFNLEVSAQQRAAMRGELGIGEHEKVLVFVANEAERKGLEPLLQAIAKLKRNDLHLLCVGRLPAAAWAPVAEKLGIGERVHWIGPTGEVAKYYAAADLFVLPTFYEPWGLVVVEAMACGLPALTSRCAGAAVAVREGETGELLDEPKNPDEIAQKLEAMLKREYFSPHQIAESVQKWAWPRVLARYEEVLLHS
jgi:UDP-glucose:(heptosyl)LPS alpha-1,3-glucosyltransferase